MDLPYVVGAVFTAIGLFVLVWNEKKRVLAGKAVDWPVAMGEIVESRVAYARPKMDDSDTLVFHYLYDVDGVAYCNKAIDLFELEKRLSLDEMETFVLAYPPGQQVQVHYDANDHAVSVLEPANHVAYFRNRWLGALPACAGVCILYFAHRLPS